MVERTLISFPSQLQLIERLQHLLYLSSSMVFISGEQGSGKSTLIEQLSNQLPNTIQQVFISLSEPTSPAQIRQHIVTQLFDQALFDADDSLANSLLLLKEEQNSDLARVVVIDNAHLLPEQLLIELAEVIKQKSSLTNNEINFVLLSDELSNEHMVNVIKLSSNIGDIAALTFKLAPLSAEEAQQLLSHRFVQIGYSPQIQHQDALLKQLLRCQGIPEKVLLLAAELNSGDLDKNKASWLKTRFPAILLMLFLVATATSLGFYLYPLFIKNNAQIESIIETEIMLLDEIVTTEMMTDELSVASTTEALAGQWSNNKQIVIDNQLSVGEADNEKRVTISELHLTTITESGSPPIKSDIANKVKFDAPTLETVTSDKPFRVAEEISSLVMLDAPEKPEKPFIDVVDSPIVKLVEPSVSQLIAVGDKVNPDVSMLSEVAEPEKVSSADSLTSLQTVSLLQPLSHDAFTSSDILLAINPNTYTLQLSGMSSEKSLKEFIVQHKLPRKNVYLYKTLRNKKPWYVVIYGQFKNRQAASHVAKNLPNTLNKLDSWVKKYASVHQDLQRNEQ